MKGKTKTLVGSAVAVVLLASVIVVGSMLSSPSRRTPPTIVLSAQQRSADDYTRGLVALQSGDTTAAIALLSSAVTLDASNTAAKDKLAEVKAAASKPSSAGSGSTTTTPGDSGSATSTPGPTGGYTEPVADLRTLLPTKYKGSALGVALADPSAAIVSGGGSAADSVSRIQWTVFDRGTPAGAQKFVTSVSKVLYGEPTDPKDAATHVVTVNGIDGYFGSDGKRLATASFSRGRFAFEVVLTSSSGSPGDLREAAVQAASAFPVKAQ